MGSAHSSKCTLSSGDLESFSKSTLFSTEEIKSLWFHFKTISFSQEFITKKEFQSAMLFHDSSLLDRIYRVVDKDDDDKISFFEYLTCLSKISTKASKEDKLECFSFHIYDFDGDGFISGRDLTAVIAATLREHGVVISRTDIDHVVHFTMNEMAPKNPGMISYDEYKGLVSTRPHMLSQFSINISSIIAEYTANNIVALTTPRGFQSAFNLHASKT